MPVPFAFSREKTLPHVAKVAMLILLKTISERPSSYPARLSGGPFFGLCRESTPVVQILRLSGPLRQAIADRFPGWQRVFCFPHPI